MPVLTRLAATLVVLSCTASSSAWAQSRTIKIATQSPLSSDQSGRGEAIKLGAELAVEQLKGPLERMGFRVELVPLDDQDRPDVGVRNAKNLVVDPGVLAVVGHLSAGVAIPASEVYKDSMLAMISPAGTSRLVTDRGLPNVSRVCGRDDVEGEVGAEFAAEVLKARSVYVVHDRTPYGRDVAEAFQAAAVRKGLRVLGLDGTDGRSGVELDIASLRATVPDLLYFAGIYSQAAPFLLQLRTQGIRTTLLGPDGLDSPGLARVAGQAVVGMRYTSPIGPAAALPRARPFVEDFRSRFGKDPGPYSAQAYDATTVALKAIEAAVQGGGRVPGREEVSAAVRRVRLQGVTGDIEFDDRGDRKKALYFVFQVTDEDPERWDRNKIVRQVTAGPRRN